MNGVDITYKIPLAFVCFKSGKYLAFVQLPSTIQILIFARPQSTRHCDHTREEGKKENLKHSGAV